MNLFKIGLTVSIVCLFIIGCQKDPLFENKIPVVHPGNDTTITLTSFLGDSIKLEGIATDQDGSITGYTWTLVSGPNTPIFVAAGSASTFVKGIVAGKYVFQLMATDNAGASSFKSISITIISNIHLTDGLLAYFPFSNNYNDQSGNDNNGTTSTAGGSLTTDHKGRPNSAFSASGNGQELIVSNNGKITFDSSFSLSFNVMTTSTGRQHFVSMVDYSTGYGQVFTAGAGAPGSRNFGLGIANYNVTCNYWAQPGEVSQSITSFIPEVGTWYNLICTFNRGISKIYLNGDLLQTETTRDKAVRICPGSEVLIGGWWSNDPGASLYGKIDEVRLYNRELNVEEVAELSKDFR